MSATKSHVARTIALTLLLAGLTTPFASGTTGTINPGCFLQVDVDVALVVDTSGSMNDQGKLAAAQAAGSAFLAQLLPNDQSALVTFNSDVTLVKGLNGLHTGPSPSTDYYLNQQSAGGLTALWMGIRMAHYELINQPHANPAPYSGLSRYPNTAGHSKQAIVLLSDGEQTVGPYDPVTEAAAAKAHGIEVFTIALGTAFPGNSLSVLANVATDSAHAFVSPTNAQLQPLFLRISALIRDVAPPTVAIARPTLPPQLYWNDIDVAPAPFAAPSNLPTVKNVLTPYATGDDDCVLDHVDFFVDERDTSGLVVGTASLGRASTSALLTLDNGSVVNAYAASAYRCRGLVGPHTIRAIATDWLGKSTTTTSTFQCIVESVTADATAAYSRVTDPADPTIIAKGAHLGSGLGVSTIWIQNTSITNPTKIEIVSGYDRVNGTPLGENGSRMADARSRVDRIMIDSLALDLTVIETTACAKLNSDWSQPLLAPRYVATTCTTNATWRWDRDPTGGYAPAPPIVLPSGCVTTTEGGATSQRCWEQGFYSPGIQVLFNERVVMTRPAASEVTMNGVDIIIERPEGRSELVLAQSYAGASYLGPQLLLGPWLALDREHDAGVVGDAPDSPATPLPLAPGVYSGRLARDGDADAYSTSVAIGEKVHALVTPSNKESLTAGTLPSVTPNGPNMRAVTVELYDPNLVLRDAKTSVLLGVPTQVELNADKTGTWVVVVRLPNGTLTTDYSFTLSVTPVALTHANDALSLQDAGADCLNGLFVGPGVHVGTLEDRSNDPGDWYRFQLYEGETVVIALRPGDTLDSTSMRLRVLDPQCHELAIVSKLILPGGLKGSPSLAQYTVPVGSGGIYRAAVEYENGIGTYELVIGSAQTAILWGFP